MSKRKGGLLVTDTSYAVVETVKGRGDVYVELLPNIWVKPSNKNQEVKIRESAKYFYPRSVSDQSHEDYLKYVRRAKFECLQPTNNKKWELLDCKVLKLGIETFEEAVKAEKLFSEYFFTTDAEAEMGPSQPKRAKKTKKATVPRKGQPSFDSESEDDGPAPVTIKTISCYDNAFKIPAMHLETSTDETDDVVNTNQPLHGENFVSSGNVSPVVSTQTINELTTVETTSSIIDEIDHQNIGEVGEQSSVIFEFVDQRKGASSKEGCNCHQKLLNKMDYFQKKMLKEVGRYRQETMQAIRQFTERFDVLLTSPELKAMIPEENEAQQIEDEEFETHFTNDFPVKDKQSIIETNAKLKVDRAYKKRFITKLKRKEKQPNEIKAVRKLLKCLCNVSCFSEFTWLGTAKKGSFSSLESLISVIIQVVEEQFPNCDAFKIIKEVVQQRTKSAADYIASVKKSGQGTELISGVEQHSGGTEDDKQDDDNVSEGQNFIPQPAVETNLNGEVEVLVI